MARGQKYRKIQIGPVEKINARNSTVGMVVLADYNDQQFNRRMLVLERPERIKATEAVKPATPRKKKSTNGADKESEGGLAFPGAGAGSA